MNWTAGILAFCLLWIPMVFIFVRFIKRDREIEQEYKEKLKDIYERHGL